MAWCLALVMLSACEKKQHDVPASAKPEKAVASAAPISSATVVSGETSSPARTSEQQSRAPSSLPRKEQTLLQVLAAAGLKPSPEVVKDLDQPITSYADLNDHGMFLIAYYLSLPSGMLEDPLRLLSFDRKTEEWRSAQVMLGGEQIGHSECLGSVLGVHAVPSAFLLDTHINPSAGCLVILDHNLAFRNALYGWYLTTLNDAQIVFQRSEVHFAAVHPAELGSTTSRLITKPLFSPASLFRPFAGPILRNCRTSTALIRNGAKRATILVTPSAWTAHSKGKLS
jgi:hypothetical protein